MGNLFKRKIDAPFDDVLLSLKPSLRSEGFELMTDIDAQNDYKRRVSDLFRRYVIFESLISGY
jgi:uncharacterized protein (DUF302 family)